MAYTLTELRAFVEPAREQFVSILPDTDCVRHIPIHVLSNRTWNKKRAEIITRLQSMVSSETDPLSTGELIIGALGEELIVREQKDKRAFQRTIWHELGHAYAKEKESTEAFWKVTEGADSADPTILDGYVLWKEFVAETIANTVAGKTKEYYYYGPDYTYVVLHDFLVYAFESTEQLPYYLGFYAAKLITEPGTLEAKRLATYDFSALKDIHPMLQDPTEEIITLLKLQMQKEAFWKIDKDLLIRLTELLQMLRGFRGLIKMREQECIVKDDLEFLQEIHPERYRG